MRKSDLGGSALPMILNRGHASLSPQACRAGCFNRPACVFSEVVAQECLAGSLVQTKRSIAKSKARLSMREIRALARKMFGALLPPSKSRPREKLGTFPGVAHSFWS